MKSGPKRTNGDVVKSSLPSKIHEKKSEFDHLTLAAAAAAFIALPLSLILSGHFDQFSVSQWGLRWGFG